MKNKQCCTCKQIISVYEFFSNKSTKDGYSRNCKKCASEQKKKSHIKHREKRLQEQKEYYKKNKKHLAKAAKKWIKNNIEKVRLIKSNWVKRNRSQINKRERENPEIYRKWDREHPERIKEIGKKTMQNAREKLSDYYVKSLICKHSDSLKHKDIPKTLVEVKKEQIKLQRLINELSN